jgi:hypothetical protein
MRSVSCAIACYARGMKSPQSALSKIGIAILAIAPSFGVSAALAPKDEYFLPNAAFFLITQLGPLALLLPFKPRPPVVAGVSIVLALYLWAFGAWVFSHPDGEGLVWLGYPFSLPGAAIGVVSSMLWLGGRMYGALAATGIAVSWVLAGIAINQTVVCATIMYCGR